MNFGSVWRLGLLYVGLVLLVVGCERSFIYFPMSSSVMDEMAFEAGWVEWVSEAGERMGWIVKARERVDGPPLLMLHGNSGSATWRLNWVRTLQGMGFGEVRVVEYPGYGGRSGRPSEEALIEAGTEAFEVWCRELAAPVFVLGESLGSGVAAGVYERVPELVRGIILAVPYDSVLNVARGRLPFLPLGWLMSDRFESVPRLRGAAVPVAIVAVAEDEVIPVRHARALRDALQENTRLLYIELEQGRHDELPIYSALWGKQVFGFLTASDG